MVLKSHFFCLVGIICLMSCPRLSYGQTEKYRDPFAPCFPEREEVKKDKFVNPPASEIGSADKKSLPDLTVTGIFLAKDASSAIINGRIYREGDVLREEGQAKIYKIEKKKVTILYGRDLYEVNIKEKEFKNIGVK